MSVNFRSLVPGGFFSSEPFAPNVNVSIRTNNPGALNVAGWIKAYPGYAGDKVTSNTSDRGGGANSTVIFETPEYGVAAWWELLHKYASGGATTIKAIINRYGGGQDYSEYVGAIVKWSGLPEDHVVDLDKDDTLLPFAKAMFRYEAGKATPLSDAQILMGFKMGRAGGKVPEAAPVTQKPSGGWFSVLSALIAPLFRRATVQTAETAEPPDLAARIVAAMRKKGYRVDTLQGEMNIAYVEGMGPDGVKNNNEPNQFNDARFVISFERGKPVLKGAWQATTEPGRYWTMNPMNEKGAARLKPGQYTAWQIGEHHGHEAWVQTGGEVTVCRDANRDFKRDGDAEDTGYFGINQHWGYDLPKNDLGRSSAGCLVGRMRQGHEEFMTMTKSDPRFVANDRFVVTACLLLASEV